MNKRFLSIVLALAMLFTMASVSADETADLTETYENLNYKVNDDNTISITGATSKNVTELVIPDEINGKPVVAIADQAFYYSYKKLQHSKRNNSF